MYSLSLWSLLYYVMLFKRQRIARTVRFATSPQRNQYSISWWQEGLSCNVMLIMGGITDVLKFRQGWVVKVYLLSAFRGFVTYQWEMKNRHCLCSLFSNESLSIESHCFIIIILKNKPINNRAQRKQTRSPYESSLGSLATQSPAKYPIRMFWRAVWRWCW